MDWQEVWETVCDMAYLRKHICREIVAVMPYDKTIPDDITLDFTWDLYSKKYRETHVVPEFQSLHVPQELFETPGASHWFEYSFPNCIITFW
jgi:hypothetical protein